MAIFSSALGLANGPIQGKQKRKTAKYVAENRYQWKTDSLRQAGLNPALAVSTAANAPVNYSKDNNHSALKLALAAKAINHNRR